ncbi:unnamed protein product [Caenorhabditis bovis]|uniref:Transcription factor AP-2 C-terminal domain-containing protein n=1 Tax=Caenorhabditis bovis TaxID=2654633 RepID=A0A8S1ELN6_9PELO|nr:unnamed protein product [Caenorhabditis bovis]
MYHNQSVQDLKRKRPAEEQWSQVDQCKKWYGGSSDHHGMYQQPHPQQPMHHNQENMQYPQMNQCYQSENNVTYWQTPHWNEATQQPYPYYYPNQPDQQYMQHPPLETHFAMSGGFPNNFGYEDQQQPLQPAQMHQPPQQHQYLNAEYSKTPPPLTSTPPLENFNTSLGAASDITTPDPQNLQQPPVLPNQLPEEFSAESKKFPYIPWNAESFPFIGNEFFQCIEKYHQRLRQYESIHQTNGYPSNGQDIQFNDYYKQQEEQPGCSKKAPNTTSLVPYIPHPRDNEVFEIVGGRFALVGNLTKYKLRIEEIRRRVGAPEFMNSSTLSCLIRKAKKKNKSDEMRQTLSREYDIVIKPCQKKGVKSTSFTPLLEEEAQVLATDLDTLTKKYYPRKHLSKLVLQSVVSNGMDVETAAGHMSKALRFLERMNAFIPQIKPKVVGSEERLSNYPQLNEKFIEISRRTHGFALLNQDTWLRESMELAGSTLEITESFRGYNQAQVQQMLFSNMNTAQQYAAQEWNQQLLQPQLQKQQYQTA